MSLTLLHEHINFRYEVLKKLGSGSNAVVLKCMDHTMMELVAIKIFRNARGIKANVQKEVEILKRLREKDFNNDHNIIRLRETFSFRGHHCICLELAGLDLRKVMKTAETVPTMQSVRLYARALLKCLSLLRKEGISHGDLKPENIVLIQNTIKTINFGQSCYGERALSDIQRIWYSAPEAILGLKSSGPMDMWSLGCIVAEMYSGEILFPGHHNAHQLALIMEVLGVPPPSMIRASPLKTSYFDECNKPRVVLDYKRYLKPPGSVKLKRRLNASNEDFIDFIRQCLTYVHTLPPNPSPLLRDNSEEPV
ncbi:dual specificity tyrosine-phosphorylation-regulated kinase 4-like [Petromyzon marinus]|uniref:dual specificity tyrosine-phosphorylation-regulated kinase 4-like n=1 Tax=Petromyzon marinus TaxID=7757 RepID=UPI003F6F98F2